MERRPAVAARGRGSVRQDRPLRRHRHHRPHPDEARSARARGTPARRSAAASSRSPRSVSPPTWTTSRPKRARAKRSTTCWCIPGAEITQNHIRSKKNSHIVALNISEHISADQPAEDILHEIRSQGALSIACHPHHRTTRRIEIGTCYLWDHRKRLAELVDVWEAANRDDLFSVTSLKHYPYVANSDFHKPKHLYSWKTLLRCEKTWEAIARTLRANVDVALTLYRNGSWAA